MKKKGGGENGAGACLLKRGGWGEGAGTFPI